MDDLWKIRYSEYQPDKEAHREALCALGNGYFVTRGAFESCHADDVHYPGTYLAGGYNRLTTTVSGKDIKHEDLVNWPDWQVLKLKIPGQKWLSLDEHDLLDYEQVLSLREGLLTRHVRIKDEHGKITRISSRKLVSMSRMHMAAIEWKIVPENWSGQLIIHSGLDGTVVNTGVERYRALKGKHLRVDHVGFLDQHSCFLSATTVQSHVSMAQAAKLVVHADNPVERQCGKVKGEEYVAIEYTTRVEQDRELRIEKTVGIFTSRDHAITDPLEEAGKEVQSEHTFDSLLNEQVETWGRVWDQSDVELADGVDQDQLLLRLHIFHLFQTCGLHNFNVDAGVPARGWHGEAYRGHILWDEIFVFPFLNMNSPAITRSLLMYRYRRLPEARRAARQAGYRGAMFPWQSGSNGQEESAFIHLNPLSGRWVPDNTYLQRHVNAAVFYNVWQYFQMTDDVEFLSSFGAEMMLDIALFWSSIATFNSDRKRFEINSIVGPDEYHTALPGQREPGVNNNAYTNFMAAWCLTKALEVVSLLDSRQSESLLRKLDIGKDDLSRWAVVSERLYIPFIHDGTVIEQFEGFDRLKDLDWKKYHQVYGEILRLDRLLEKEGDRVENYKAVKQADVLMLFYLFSSEQLEEMFVHMGYTYSPDLIPNCIAYYAPITSHGSTLSKLVYSWIQARSHRETSWRDFSKALISDFEDIQGGTTPEGIHLGAMAGTVDMIQRCYTGMELRHDELCFNPRLPDTVDRIRFGMRYRGRRLEIDLTSNELCIRNLGGRHPSIDVIVREKRYRLHEGDERKFRWREESKIQG